MPSKYDGICGCGKKLLRVKPDQVPYQFCSLKCKRAAKKAEDLIKNLRCLFCKKSPKNCKCESPDDDFHFIEVQK